MKVKHLIIIVSMFISVDAYSQEIISVLKDFYMDADMDCYTAMAKKRMMDEHYLRGKWSSIYQEYAPSPDIVLNKNNSVPILNVKFINTKDYNYFDDMYDHITIDSVWAFTFFRVDKRMKVDAVINLAMPSSTYFIDKTDFAGNTKGTTRLLKRINKNNPELILRCAALMGGFGKYVDDGYMYIKGDKIYKYVMYDRKSYELNDYFRNFLRIEDTRCYLNITYIPLIYQKDENSRHTGNAPENEKMICPQQW